MPKPKIAPKPAAPKPVVAKPKPVASLPPKGAPKQNMPKPKINMPFYKEVVEDGNYTIIPPKLPTAITTLYSPEKDPYPIYSIPNGASANIGKLGTAKPAPKRRIVRRRENL